MDPTSLSVVSWIAIVVLAVSAINGVRLGMVKTVFSTFTFIAALILAAAFSPKLNTILQESALYKVINAHRSLSTISAAMNTSKNARTLKISLVM